LTRPGGEILALFEVRADPDEAVPALDHPPVVAPVHTARAGNAMQSVLKGSVRADSSIVTKVAGNARRWFHQIRSAASWVSAGAGIVTPTQAQDNAPRQQEEHHAVVAQDGPPYPPVAGGLSPPLHRMIDRGYERNSSHDHDPEQADNPHPAGPQRACGTRCGRNATPRVAVAANPNAMLHIGRDPEHGDRATV